MKKAKTKTVLQGGGYRAITSSRAHKIYMDRPNVDGGNDSAATPIEHLLAAIGGCVSMTLRVFSEQKNINTGQITVEVKQKNKLTSEGLITTFEEKISFEKDITDVQKEKLLVAAGKCPVVQLLKNNTKINSIIV